MPVNFTLFCERKKIDLNFFHRNKSETELSPMQKNLTRSCQVQQKNVEEMNIWKEKKIAFVLF